MLTSIEDVTVAELREMRSIMKKISSKATVKLWTDVEDASGLELCIMKTTLKDKGTTFLLFRQAECKSGKEQILQVQAKVFGEVGDEGAGLLDVAGAQRPSHAPLPPLPSASCTLPGCVGASDMRGNGRRGGAPPPVC